MLNFIKQLLDSILPMGIKVGDIDIGDAVLQHEYTLRFILKYLDLILIKNPNLNKPTRDQIQEIKDQILRELQTKYPNMGIQPK